MLEVVELNIHKLKFSLFSFADNLLFLVFQILPYFLRLPFYKILFSDFGKRNHIDFRCYFRYAHKISIGSDVSINRGSSFFAGYLVKEASISIGDHVAIGPECRFFAAGHDTEDLNLADTGAPIVVGSYVWIGGGTVILQGVTVGEGAIVAGGSLVTKSVEPYTIVGGNPARKIKDRIIKTAQDS